MPHGEYKMPGGKLVVVDFEIDADRRLSDVVVSGDFFLYPDEVLDAITSALESMPTDTAESWIVAAITENIPAAAKLIGVTPEGVAIAVQRALHDEEQE